MADAAPLAAVAERLSAWPIYSKELDTIASFLKGYRSATTKGSGQGPQKV